MTALPAAPSIDAVRDVIRRLQALAPGAYRVVSCYLKLEPRDKTRGKYLIKMKNRVRERSEEHTSELQSRLHLVCRLLLEKKKKKKKIKARQSCVYEARTHTLR